MERQGDEGGDLLQTVAGKERCVTQRVRHAEQEKVLKSRPTSPPDSSSHPSTSSVSDNAAVSKDIFTGDGQPSRHIDSFQLFSQQATWWDIDPLSSPTPLSLPSPPTQRRMES
ncbi:unnamed protein product [Pleuronectes platessa]|uniref:Uncharacterized protein n=1 Tax=Pleuronectes platessa TaxID=8262 RepID=A0A9N7Z420_PLEPL|nr:unnamed protein product [Pleuronectes platessa]